MMKKKVPEWLNSSLWSAPTPLSPAATEDSSGVVSPSETPPPLSPPVVVVQDPPPTQIIEDSRTEDHDDETPSAYGISHQAQLLTELSRKVMDMRELRRLACQGVPDTAGIRSTLWKLLLGYLPPDRGLWSSELVKKRSQYQQFKEEILMNPSEITRRMYNSTSCDADDAKSDRALLSRSEIPHGEHPLSLGKSSVWNQFFQDTEIIDQIDRDVKRTHPDMHFFSGDSQFAKSNQDALKNILIIFAKLNPGVRYVQGMNEILAPLFYVFKNDPDEENAAFAEADAFFCFVDLLSGFRDNFVQQLDNSVVGIRATITKLSQLLRKYDEELWRHLEMTSKSGRALRPRGTTQFAVALGFYASIVFVAAITSAEKEKVNPQFYAFRWITLLLTQEFNFADSLHIWDTLLGDPEGPQETLLRVCCAMLILIRKRLLAGDFTSNLKLLQSYPTTNISHLLYVANKFRVQSV